MKIAQPRLFEPIDTTLREGAQSPLLDDTNKFFFSQKEKLDLIDALSRFGVRYFEVFSPIVSQQEHQDLLAIIAKKKELQDELKTKIFILSHVRCHPADIELAINAGVDGLNIYIGTSEHSRKYNHGKELDTIIGKARPLLAQIRKQNPHMIIRFSGEDAFRTSEKDLFYVYDQIIEYVDRLGTPDTVGIADPEHIAKRIQALKKRYPHIPLEGHFHNDRGFSLVNALTAVYNGMEFINTSILGLGERSGITSMTGLFLNLYLHDPTYLKKFDSSVMYALNVLVADMLNIQVPTTEPVSLTNRTHSAGVHTGAQLKGSSAYEALPLAEFGVNETRLLLGPLSGSHIIRYYLKHILNYAVNDEIVPVITNEFKNRIYKKTKKQTPTVVLEQIAKSFKIPHISRPVAHEEYLQ